MPEDSPLRKKLQSFVGSAPVSALRRKIVGGDGNVSQRTASGASAAGAVAGGLVAGPAGMIPGMIVKDVSDVSRGRPSFYDYVSGLTSQPQPAPAPAPVVPAPLTQQQVQRSFASEADALKAEREWVEQNAREQDKDVAGEREAQMTEAIERKQNQDAKRSAAVTQGEAELLLRNKK